MPEDQVILITGTRRGIGRYLVQHYVEAGNQVVGCSRSPVDYELQNYQHFCLDVSDETKVKKMFSEIRNAHQRLDVLINNAGVMSRNQMMLTNIDSVHDVFNTNFIGTFLFCREASKLMQRNSFGRIVNLSTIHVPLGTTGTAIYSASKAAVEQFSKVLARELAPFGITVNTLGLSFVNQTGMVDGLSEDAIEEALQHTILGSRLQLEDVAHAMDFLISEKSHSLTNQTLYLGGV